jgi:hypothetical protein
MIANVTWPLAITKSIAKMGMSKSYLQQPKEPGKQGAAVVKQKFSLFAMPHCLSNS